MTAPKTDAIITAAVDKFLCWKLPQNFQPDSFISFDGKKHDTWGGYPNSWPTGTNLLDAGQARAMFEHCLNDALAALQAIDPPVEQPHLQFTAYRTDDTQAGTL